MTDGTSKVLTINDPDSLNNDAGVTSVAISPNGQFVAAGSLDTVVRIWDVATGTLLERLRGHRDSVYSVAFTPDGKGLVSGSLDKTLKYWDVSGLSASGVKSRKEGANGSSSNGPGVLVRKESEKASSQCTMNFTGHKVCRLYGSFYDVLTFGFRIMFFLWLFRTTANGLFRGLRIEGCSFGMPRRL